MENLPNNLGETRFYSKQIILCTKQTPKQKVITYLHELTHVVSEEYGLKFSEEKVLLLENLMPYLLKPGNIFNTTRRKKKTSE
jgi:hypothetical protein